MRLWSIHPIHLDRQGLVALWREGLLAQKVLAGQTRGYRNHPQLWRFRQTANPLGAIAVYLRHVCDEAQRRDYQFDRNKILNRRYRAQLPVTQGQVDFELKHLLTKLKSRSPLDYTQLRRLPEIALHPLFTRIPGDVEPWEIR